MENNVDIIKLLLQLKANPGLYGMGICAGKTALGAAVRSESHDVAKFLQSLQIQSSKVPKSYSHRYLRLNRFVPVEVGHANFIDKAPHLCEICQLEK